LRLIGMLDSPYVRRVAISLHALGVGFEHEPLSVFRTFDAFAAVNPVVKAPTLVTDEGVVLMDSTLILDHVEQVAGASLMPPPGAGERLQALRLLGLALAACEKSVALLYETLRPAERRDGAWVERVSGQALAAFELLERDVAGADGWLVGERMLQPDIATAVAWRFTRLRAPELADSTRFPALAAFSERLEREPAFLAAPID
jgi:glutathione S-transferase